MMMPMGEDEYDQYDDQLKNQHGMSKAEQRRSNKPIMEKRRRARINHCLNELKSLILDAMKKDPARHSKLEKADILEMTVKHLQTVQRQQLAVAVATDPSVLHKFKTGFSECAGEVSRYISNLEGVDAGVKQRLVSHLAQCVTGLQQLSPFNYTSVFPSSQDLNNNQRLNSHLQGLQLIPSRLPTGELALLVPNSSNMPFFPAVSATGNVPSSTVTSGGIERNHPSAFTAVSHRDVSMVSKSPPMSPTTSTSSEESVPSDYQGGGCVPVTHYQSQNHQRQMNSSFVGESGFKVPMRSQTFQPTEHKSPQQHSAVSSTCLPLDGSTGVQSQNRGLPTFAHVNVEFKAVPISRGVIHTSQQPLTVVTSQIYDIPTGSERLHGRKPLDFTVRKGNNRQSASTQTQPSSFGGVKRQFPAHEGGSELISSSMGSPNKAPRFTLSVAPGVSGRDYCVGVGRVAAGNDRPSTSTAAADAKDSMWRPW